MHEHFTQNMWPKYQIHLAAKTGCLPKWINIKYYTIEKNIQLLRTQHWFQVFHSKKYKIGGNQSRMSLPANKITCFEGICLNEIHRFAIVYELSFKNST